MSPPDEGRDEEATLNGRVQAERDLIFQAMSIVECCRYACASKYPYNDLEFMAPALEAAHDVLGAVAGELETIADEVKDVAAAPSRRNRTRAKKGKAPRGRPGRFPVTTHGAS